jgi:hypothetical protein
MSMATVLLFCIADTVSAAPLTSVVIVMMDTRPALPAAAQGWRHLHYQQLAFELNRAYACAHNYDMLYLHMRRPTCSHPALGERHPSYCKLAAVAEALGRGYDLVAFLDSDAFFQNHTQSLPALLAAHGTEQHADVSFAWDHPYSRGPNAGVQFWRNTQTAWQLLRLWWHTPGGAFHLQHDYEQHVLHWVLLGTHAFRDHVLTLRLQVMASRLDARGWPVYPDPIAHVDHVRAFHRPLIAARALLRNAQQRLPSLPMLNGTDDEVAPQLRWQTARHREQLLRLADRFLKRRNHTTHVERVVPRRRPRTCQSSVEHFDATAAAAMLARARAPRAAYEASHTDFLWGLPLQLANCTHSGDVARMHWWVRWRRRPSGEIIVQPPRELSHGRSRALCLRVGPAFATHDPTPWRRHFPLVQLAPCDGLSTLRRFEMNRANASIRVLRPGRQIDGGHAGVSTNVDTIDSSRDGRAMEELSLGKQQRSTRNRDLLTPKQLLETRRRQQVRRKRRRSRFVGQPCTSATKGDTKFEDCEGWCDQGKIGHCKMCKCRGCVSCHQEEQTPAQPERPLNAIAAGQHECELNGLCLNSSSSVRRLCLSVPGGRLQEGARARPQPNPLASRYT